ncbi:MAG: hypothetical protein LKF96_09745 [Treponema sp.]|jgi:hypothetical protein|nr:hypothetical protein [Treponema sp.]
MTEKIPDKKFSLKYDFNTAEIVVLAKFFRDHQSNLPREILPFASAVEKVVYNTLSVEEVERFYT